MRNKIKTLLITISFCLILAGCNTVRTTKMDSYGGLLRVEQNPEGKERRTNPFYTDRGAWIGFGIHEDKEVTGFCGPYDLDGRSWLSSALLQVGTNPSGKVNLLTQDSSCYYPDRLWMRLRGKDLEIEQTLKLVSSTAAILHIQSKSSKELWLYGDLNKGEWTLTDNTLWSKLPNGELLLLSFEAGVELRCHQGKYEARLGKADTRVVLSHYANPITLEKALVAAKAAVEQSTKLGEQHTVRWMNYIDSNTRPELTMREHRIMVKSMMTLMSNWRSAKKELKHDGVVPSHVADYFVGFWAWDSWKHAVALAQIDPALAKDQVRAMFDFQDSVGMIADCIYTDHRENNYRDSKPPLAAWAVNAIYEADHDLSFVREMYDKLVLYHAWWFRYRDHNKNGICEYGATDGTLEAAKWESGMDNAIRYDSTQMLVNEKGAWSMDQESVELSAYLELERKYLMHFAELLGVPFRGKKEPYLAMDYFFDKERGYYFDRKLDGPLITCFGPEGWSPLWTGLATAAQAEAVAHVMRDTAKFGSFVPFPTAALDDPKFMDRGYWRGPIWLDQVYFAISGLRRYGYQKEADLYTQQVFERLEGLSGTGPIHENYEARTGKRLKAPHFSWSAAHLFLLYKELKTSGQSK
ncbi:MAG: glycoside hydrolase [Sphingobacterium sp.]|jgi:putative isomerase|nr:glycoside hydrolase [Sphingobacterium sp.]